MKKYAALYDLDGELFVRLFDADDTAHAAEQAEDATEEDEVWIALRPVLQSMGNFCSNEIARAMLDGRL